MDVHNLARTVKELWNGWELRILMLQLILTILGNRRKYSAGFRLGTVVWLAYLSADWVATLSLGVLARSEANSNLIPIFWAPILLLHLGGPETITAYSLEDNELWLRRLLELVIQALVASYVLFKLWTKNSIVFVAITIFVPGIIKYGERVWAVRLASTQNFGRQANDYSFGHDSVLDRSLRSACRNSVPEARFLHEARLLFKTSEILITNSILGVGDQKETYELISKKIPNEAFKLIEVELGFMYDLHYSKVRKVSFPSFILHSITLLSSVAALVSFSKMTINNRVYSKSDTSISYLLLVGAVLLEIYSIIVLFLSDWTMLWLSSSQITGNFLFGTIGFFKNRKRWSGSMAQHNLIESSLSKNVITYMPRIGNIHSWEDVKDDLKELIFSQVLHKRSRYNPGISDFNVLKQLLAERGDEAFRSKDCLEEFRWSLGGVEFIHSLLTWHIATHICYCNDLGKNGGSTNPDPNGRMSQSLSNYLMYLLVDHPTMLPRELGQIRYHDTSMHFFLYLFSDNGPLGDQNLTYLTIKKWLLQTFCCGVLLKEDDWINAFVDELLQNRSIIKAIQDVDEGGMSALLDGCMLAMSLQSWETKEGWRNGQKWEMISQVWVDILMYASSHCGWKEHAQALAQGGEVLTHVALLMAHFGLSEQCPPQLSDEAARSTRLADLLSHA